ncbi:Inosose dehydratase [Pseudovibrio axinellae]|uniref:Inosose dehydratase n=1 Tax=Pseudovibrio axinellae TaxID=989403 RepID=A0A165XY52_9HYPH|nr:Inosose dehydratase [Pseudovibrio axinellae]SER71714.1 Sugar phosphate isomerase/epimerase [Pseudovibrio axinellae]
MQSPLLPQQCKSVPHSFRPIQYCKTNVLGQAVVPIGLLVDFANDVLDYLFKTLLIAIRHNDRVLTLAMAHHFITGEHQHLDIFIGAFFPANVLAIALDPKSNPKFQRLTFVCGCCFTHLQVQLIAVHPAYDQMFDGFAAQHVRSKPKARQQWAVQQMLYAAQASQNFGISDHVRFSGALAWPYIYPRPQRPAGLVEEAFHELARRWTPILSAFDEAGVNVCYKIHPGEDLHDGNTFEMFLERVNNHPRANILYDPTHFLMQQLDYHGFLDVYADRIKMFHVKDAEFNASPKQGVYSGYQSWVNRAGRFRFLGDGQVDFEAIFSKLTAMNSDGRAVMEWECALKHPEQGAAEGAGFIADRIIRVTDHAFDDFAGADTDDAINRNILGLLVMEHAI